MKKCERCGNPNPEYKTTEIGCPTFCDFCLLIYVRFLEQKVQQLEVITSACSEFSAETKPSTADAWLKKNKPKCKKCNGAGWLFGRELDNPSEDTYNDSMTKYNCDRCNSTGTEQ